MQHDLARAVELTCPYSQQAVGPVDVLTIETDRLTDAHPGDCEKTEQGSIGDRPERRSEGRSPSKESGHFEFAVDVGSRSSALRNEKICGRHLCGRIQGVKILGKATDRSQSLMPSVRRDVDWLLGPAQGEICCCGCRLPPVEVGDVVTEHVLRLPQLETDAAADAQVVVERLLQRVHGRASGQGRAKARNATRSTFA